MSAHTSLFRANSNKTYKMKSDHQQHVAYEAIVDSFFTGHAYSQGNLEDTGLAMFLVYHYIGIE